MSETTTCQKCHGRGTYVHPDMGSLICDCRSLWENMGASLAHLPHPAVAEVTRLEAALSAAREREANLRAVAQPFLRALEFQEEWWADIAEEGEDPTLPDYFGLDGRDHKDYRPTVAHARALRRALSDADGAGERSGG